MIHSPNMSMRDRLEHSGFRRADLLWDLLWLLVLFGLALLPPVGEIHKQLILLAIGAFQLLEGWVIRKIPKRGPAECVLLKIALASLLIDHTGEATPLLSSYYPIYYLPVMTAAMYFGPVATFFWTTLTAAAYCSYLFPTLEEFDLTEGGKAELSFRILFFYLVAMIVNRFVTAYQVQTRRYREVAEGLEEANRNLKQAQAEARRSERLAALGQMSAGLAHEIRNPLGVIKGSAEMLNQKLANADPVSSELAGYVYTEVNRLSALVSRFLDFARPARLELRPLDLRAVVDRAVKLVFDQPVATQVKLEKDYAADLPMVYADEQFCEQVFINLAQNACEAMQPEGGILWIRIRVDVRKGERGVKVELEDSGPGIPAELREQIFNPFVTTKKTGVGLGLSIVSKIMDDHGGSIRLVAGHVAREAAGDVSERVANEARGACFELFFPAHAHEEAGATTTESSAKDRTAQQTPTDAG